MCQMLLFSTAGKDAQRVVAFSVFCLQLFELKMETFITWMRKLSACNRYENTNQLDSLAWKQNGRLDAGCTFVESHPDHLHAVVELTRSSALSKHSRFTCWKLGPFKKTSYGTTAESLSSFYVAVKFWVVFCVFSNTNLGGSMWWFHCYFPAPQPIPSRSSINQSDTPEHCHGSSDVVIKKWSYISPL